MMSMRCQIAAGPPGLNASPVHRSTSRASSAPQRRLVSAHAERQQQQQQRSAPTGFEWLLRAFTQRPARHKPHREQHPAQPAASAVVQKSRAATGSTPLPPPLQDQHQAAPPLHHQQQLHTAAGHGHASNGHRPIKASASQLLSGVPLEQMVQRRQAERQLQRGQQSIDRSGSGSWDEDFNPQTNSSSRSSSSSNSSNGLDVNGSISAEGGQSAGALGVTSPEAAIALAAYQDAIAHRRMVPVVFKLKHVVQPGQRLKVVGGHKSLGGWALHDAPELQRSSGNVWQATIKLPAGSVSEYKYALLDANGNVVTLQAGNNGVLAVRMADQRLEVQDSWSGDSGGVAAEGESGLVSRTTRETRLVAWASDMFQQISTMRQDLRRARMEVVGAQEEAREARNQAARYQNELRKKQMQLAEVETAHALDKSMLVEAQTMTHLLQAQLSDTTASLHEAIETAAGLLAAQEGEEEEEEESEEEEEEEEHEVQVAR